MRRRRDLIGMFVAAIGGPVADSRMISIIRAADLVAAAETQRAISLRGQPVDVASLVKLENLASRAVKLLGLPSEANKATPTLGDLLRQDLIDQREAAT